MTARRQFLAGSATALASINILRLPARAAQFEYKWAHDLPVTYPMHKRMVAMADDIERETSGRLKLSIYPNSILGGQSAMLSQMRSGAIQFLSTMNVVYTQVVPAAGIEALGFAFKDAQQAVKTMEGPLGTYVREQFMARNIYACEKRWSLGMRQVCSNDKSIKRPEDFDGFKMRTPPGQISVDLFRTLGASPTPITATEMYTSLKTRLVDGLELPVDAVQLFKIYEVIKYISITNHMWTGYFVTANLDAWKALPPDIQAAVERNNSKYAVLEQQDREAAEGFYRKQLQGEGIGFTNADVDAMRAKLKPYYAKWKGEFGAQAWALLENSTGTRYV